MRLRCSTDWLAGAETVISYVYTYIAFLVLLQASAQQSGVPLTEDCSVSARVIANLRPNAAVEVRGSIAGDEGPCYSVTAVINGNAITGYVHGNDLTAVAAFNHQREAISASVDGPRAAVTSAEAAPVRPHYPPFKDFSAVDMKGRVANAHTLKGRVNLICFWSPSNPESVREFLAVTQLYGQLKQQGVDVLAVSLSDRPELEDALDDFHVGFPNVPRGYDIAERLKVDSIP